MSALYQILVRDDCTKAMKRLPDQSVHAVVCDPPYHLTSGSTQGATGFMGKEWDGGDVAFRVETWREAFRLLMPGGHLLAFGGTRTYHRMVCAIEDAGFEIRDSIHYTFGSGFPKSHSVEKNLPPDHAEAWKGWGTALKPSHEVIVMARRPLEGTVAQNVLAHGTGALNIDQTRVPHGDDVDLDAVQRQQHSEGAIDGAFGAANLIGKEIPTYKPEGRWPANTLLQHSPGCDEECVEGCPVPVMDEQSGVSKSTGGKFSGVNALGQDSGWNAHNNRPVEISRPNDSGGASRYFNVFSLEPEDYAPFFYTPKAARKEREAGLDHLRADVVERTGMAGRGQPGLKCKLCGKWKASGSPCVCPEPEFEQSNFKRPAVANDHPTVKSIALMEWCVKLVTPPGGVVLDPFMGSGSTGIAAVRSGFNFIGMEADDHYMDIAEARIRHHGGKPEVLRT